MVFAISTAVLLAGGRSTSWSVEAEGRDPSPAGRADASIRGMAHGASWDIPIQRTPDVERWIDFYTSGRGREYFSAWLDRMSRYEGPIRKELRRRDMPEDLVYIALIESGFEPRAVSRARASGLWQFMPGTARDQGLVVNAYVDERMDPLRSTTAAIDFLDSLHGRFGSWYLAVAAYNAGPSRVLRALRAHVGENGPWNDDDFWEIAPYLPTETRQHVPRLIASAVLGKEPGHFGFRPEVSEPRTFETVYALGETPLDQVAGAAEVSVEEVRSLNPHLVGRVTPPGTIYPVRVPTGTAGRVMAALSPDRAASSVGSRLGE